MGELIFHLAFKVAEQLPLILGFGVMAIACLAWLAHRDYEETGKPNLWFYLGLTGIAAVVILCAYLGTKIYCSKLHELSEIRASGDPFNTSVDILKDVEYKVAKCHQLWPKGP